MLNIPYRIKSLLNTDSVNKNIRIHFPNGERSDICNNQIVQDTVEFTESLCSQNTLKFGLCESPIFECEVVGVGNIKGNTIEVYCEVYCDASVSGAIWQNDLQHYVYQIPYGTFVVDSCKRQADMIHRKIVAYSGFTEKDWTISPTEKIKEGRSSDNTTLYTPNVGYFLMANGFNIIEYVCDKTSITDYEGTANLVPIVWVQHPVREIKYMDVELVGGRFVISRTWELGPFVDDYDAVYVLKPLNINIPRKELYEYIYNKAISIIESDDPNIQQVKEGDIAKVINYIYDGFIENPHTLSSEFGSNNYPFYPQENDYHYYYMNFYQEMIITIWRRDPDGPGEIIIERETITLSDVTPELTKYKYKNDAPKWTELTETIPNVRYGTAEGNIPLLKVDWSKVDLQKDVPIFAELAGVFLKKGRGSEIFPINIRQQFGLVPSETLYPNTSLYPQSVTGGKLYPWDYQNCWYDDEYNKPFGAIVCGYTDSNNNNCEFTLYLMGYDEDSDTDTYQVYNLNNAYLKENKWSESDIQDLCEWIADSISGVNYMPVDFVGRGLPYVEAGDTFTILTKSNDSIITIVLHRTLKGEQCLIDSYKSV